jgi:DNA repair exonuclease SbcCD ATPase subunit
MSGTYEKSVTKREEDRQQRRTIGRKREFEVSLLTKTKLLSMKRKEFTNLKVEVRNYNDDAADSQDSLESPLSAKRDRAKRLKRLIKTIEAECEELQANIYQMENQPTTEVVLEANRTVSPLPPQDTTDTPTRDQRDLQMFLIQS